MTVHDQIDTICREELAESWKTTMTEIMEAAAKTIVTNGLLKADTNISKHGKSKIGKNTYVLEEAHRR